MFAARPVQAVESTSRPWSGSDLAGIQEDEMPLHFKSFRTRLLVLFLGLLAIVQIAAFLIVNTATTNSARRQIDSALVTTAESFRELLKERTGSLLVAARLLSASLQG